MTTTPGLTIEATEVASDLFPYQETDDPNRRAHIVRGLENPHLWHDGMTGQDLVDVARVLGEEVKALCGYVWVPSLNPDKHEICKPCLEIWNREV